MGDLHGVAVLVTRPEHQATPLCNLLEAQGAITLRLAAIRVEPAGDRHGLMSRLGPIDAFDLIMFTSANAVKFGSWLLGEHRDLKLAAIGPATTRALGHAGFRATIVPEHGFDSENLLQHPELQSSIAQRVLIVKGMGGRQLLQQQLEQRGARVVVAEVYARTPVRHAPEALAMLEARFGAGEIHVITATSTEIAESLLALATPGLRREFERVHWLVPSARVAAALRARGVTAPVVQADSAEDHDLVAAIARWRASVSDA